MTTQAYNAAHGGNTKIDGYAVIREFVNVNRTRHRALVWFENGHDAFAYAAGWGQFDQYLGPYVVPASTLTGRDADEIRTAIAAGPNKRCDNMIIATRWAGDI